MNPEDVPDEVVAAFCRTQWGAAPTELGPATVGWVRAILAAVLPEHERQIIAGMVRVGVAALIIRDAQLLVSRRLGAHGTGTWAPPGGHLEHGETPEHAAVREAAEEVALTVRPVERLGYVTDVIEGRHYVTLGIGCEMVGDQSPQIMEPGRATNLTWLPLDDLRTRQDLFPPLRSLLERMAHDAEHERQVRAKVAEEQAREPDTLVVYPANEILYGRCETCGEIRWHTELTRHRQQPIRSKHCGCCTHPHDLERGGHEGWQPGKPCPCYPCRRTRGEAP